MAQMGAYRTDVRQLSFREFSQTDVILPAPPGLSMFSLWANQLQIRSGDV